MKKLKLFSTLIFAMIGVLIAGCSKDNQQSSSTRPSSPTNSSSSDVVIPPSNALEEALSQDYSNATITVEQVYLSYAGDLLEEYAYELNYEGYTIIQSLDNPDLDDLYYHDYQGESYLYFEDNYGTGDAWLSHGYKDSPLALENTYFSTKVALQQLKAEDATYAAGSYIIDDSEVVANLNMTMFLFAWYIDVDYVSISVSNGQLYRIVGMTEESDDVFVRVTFSDVGTTTYSKTLPEKPNENNVKTYAEYTGITPTPDVDITSITIDYGDDTEDGIIEIEEEIEIKRTYLPENATKTSIQWFSTNPEIATINYSFTAGQAVIKGISAGTTEVYAMSENQVESNRLTIKVNPLAEPTLENCLYEFTFTSLNDDNSVTVINQLANGKTAAVSANKASVYSGANGDNVFTADDTLLVLNPSKQGGSLDGAYVAYDFGLQQVSGISFYYGLQWNADKNNASWLTQAEVQVSTDGAVWTMAADILEEIKTNVSSNNLKLLEVEFAPTTYVRVLLKSNMIGKDFRFSTTQMNFYANDNCEELPPEPTEIKVESITISTTASTIEVGDSLTFQAVVSPEDATNKTIIWQSSQPSIATITQEGVLTALSSGTVEITALSYDSTVRSNVISITIADKPIVLPSAYLGTWKGTDLYGVDVTLTIQENQATLVVDSSEEISLTLSSYDEANKSYTFVTEDLEEVIVSIPSGYSDVLNVEANLASTIIMADHEDSDNPAFSRVVPVTSITISANTSSTTLNINDSLQLSINVYPNNANEGTKITWNSSNPDVASVSSSGQVVAKAPGQTTITATSANGIVSNQIVITVNEPVSGGDVSEIEDIVGTWETANGDIDYDAFETLTFTINADGSADLNCEASSSLADHMAFTYVRTDGTNYVFVDEDGYELTFEYASDGYGYLYYEGDYLYLYGTSSYEKIA